MIGLAAICCVLGVTPPQHAPIARTTHFAFHSSIWLNLHHFLYVQARAKRGMDQGRAVVARVLADTTGWGTLSRREQDAWTAALAYYDRALAAREAVFDTMMVESKAELIQVDERGTLNGAKLDAELIAALRSAEPVYRKLWWPRHDAANRAWIAQAVPQLRERGDTIANRVARAFHTEWPAQPIRVDVTAYANWAGAYTTADPAHITVSNPTPTPADDILETMHHEALHTMDRPLLKALLTAAQNAGKSGAWNLIHPLIFFTAGEVTRQIVPGHQPFAEKGQMWERPAFAPYRAAIYGSWGAFLAGKISFEEAVAQLVASLNSGAVPQGASANSAR